jgi:hypothetical protein
VGVETLPRRMRGLPAMRLSLAVVVSASAGGLAGAPGATPGQTGRVRWLGAGGHPDCWACSAVKMAEKRQEKSATDLFMMIRPLKNFAPMIAGWGRGRYINRKF